MVVYFAYWSLPEDNGFAHPEYLSFRSFCREIIVLGFSASVYNFAKAVAKVGCRFGCK
jgi:hypothetical protein